MELQRVELELLVTVCKKYRSTLPAHLLASREQIAIADAILEKLERIPSS